MAYARQVKRRRGTESENNAFTGAEGEIVVDTTNHRLRVHDGATLGGFAIPNFNDFNDLKAYLENILAQIPRVPAGLIAGWGGKNLPPGRWFWCRGGQLYITDHPELYAAIGGIYGPVTDGKFYLPNANDGTLFAINNDLVGRNDPGSLPGFNGGINIRCEANYAAATQDAWGSLGYAGNSANIVRPSSSGRGTWDFGIDINPNRVHALYDRYYDGNRVVPASLFIPGFIISY